MVDIVIDSDLQIKIIRDVRLLDKGSFNSFLRAHSNGNFFQSFGAFKFFETVEGYTPLLVVALQSNEYVGCLSAVIIRERNKVKGYLSRRCIIYGGPIIKNDDHEITQKILQYFDRALTKVAIYSEFRAFFDMDSYKTLFANNDYYFEEHLNYIVPITSVEENKKLLNSSKRRQLNLSFKNGAKIIEPKDLSDIKSFYEILKNLYKTKVKKPVPGFEFFEKFYNQNELGKYFLIQYDGKIIGGIMCPIYNDKIYEWFVCGLDGEIKNVYPSVMATWAPIEYGANNGLKYFDFLGAGKPDVDYGVRDFKSKFGGQLVNYGRFIKVYNKTLYNLGKIGLEIIGKIKQ